MLRRIWHRTVAFALPITLAICLPPLAVIAFNLHAQSSPVRPRASSRSHATTSRLERGEFSATLRPRQFNRKARSVQQDPIASGRN